MSQTNCISLVVPSFNQAPWLDACLVSIFGQKDPALEVILIDGGSSDGTKEIIKQYESKLTYWVSEPDKGQSQSLNKGFSRATGKWLGWLNSDDLLLPGALAALREAVQVNPQAKWFTGGGWFIDEQGRRVKHFEAPVKPLSAEDLSPWTHTWFAQPGCFFMRDVFERTGGYVREDLHYAMDLDLWLRLGKLCQLHPLDCDMGAYRLHGKSKTVAERPEMEVEVVRVLAEHLGLEAALARVEGVAKDKFEIEFHYRRLTEELRSPIGWLRLIRRQLLKCFKESKRSKESINK